MKKKDLAKQRRVLERKKRLDEKINGTIKDAQDVVLKSEAKIRDKILEKQSVKKDQIKDQMNSVREEELNVIIETNQKKYETEKQEKVEKLNAWAKKQARLTYLMKKMKAYVWYVFFTTTYLSTIKKDVLKGKLENIEKSRNGFADLEQNFVGALKRPVIELMKNYQQNIKQCMFLTDVMLCNEYKIKNQIVGGKELVIRIAEFQKNVKDLLSSFIELVC